MDNKKEIVDNLKGVPLEHYMEAYASLDCREASVRTGVAFDEEKGGFVLSFLNTRLLIEYPEFAITPLEETPIASVFQTPTAKIFLLRFLEEGAQAAFRGTFKTYREMPWGEIYDKNFNGRCQIRAAYAFGMKLDAFSEAAKKLGGKEIRYGDAAFEFPVLENMCLELIVREGDDEFPPTAQFLFSDNMAISLSAEDRVVICEQLIIALKAMMS